MHIILPKKRPVLAGSPLEDLPLFFLAGPILGGGDWQRHMSEILARGVADEACIIVNPSRYGEEHPHYQYRLDGPELDERQTSWERYYLRQAADHAVYGCIVFWLAEQVEERRDGKPYASDTRGELGEWRGHLIHQPYLRVVVGADTNFPGLSVIRENFRIALGNNFTIYDSMEETADAALSLRSKPSSRLRSWAGA